MTLPGNPGMHYPSPCRVAWWPVSTGNDDSSDDRPAGPACHDSDGDLRQLCLGRGGRSMKVRGRRPDHSVGPAQRGDPGSTAARFPAVRTAKRIRPVWRAGPAVAAGTEAREWGARSHSAPGPIDLVRAARKPVWRGPPARWPGALTRRKGRRRLISAQRQRREELRLIPASARSEKGYGSYRPSAPGDGSDWT